MFPKVPLAILLLTVVIVCESAAIDDIPGGSNINGNQSSIPEDSAPKTRLGSSKYVVLSYVSVDFSGSLQTCRSYGLQPATITSQKDNIDVQDALAMSSTYGSSYWIGATNLGRPNNYLWITSNRPIWYPNGLSIAILLLAVVIVCDSAAIGDIISTIPDGTKTTGNQSTVPEPPAVGRRSGSSKYVVLSDRLVDFVGALQACRTYGLQPASITSQKDTAEVQIALASSSSQPRAAFWIGATNLGRPNNFLWLTSNRPIWYPNGYLNWDVGEPNNVGGVEHCVEVINVVGAPWNDTNCLLRRGVICQV
ncbi:hypothetical protein pipiens_008140 [Culex pipiens pipiens]|uniref:C-type lectin domain-containing protein n=1 Tax=Culex pipiens pipiens TaxID=38569 RepID=A0ABD1DIG1_CULPP